jgi:hypothetical protein
MGLIDANSDPRRVDRGLACTYSRFVPTNVLLVAAFKHHTRKSLDTYGRTSTGHRRVVITG